MYVSSCTSMSLIYRRPPVLPRLTEQRGLQSVDWRSSNSVSILILWSRSQGLREGGQLLWCCLLYNPTSAPHHCALPNLIRSVGSCWFVNLPGHR